MNLLLYVFNLLFLFALFISYSTPFIKPDNSLWPIAMLGLAYPYLLLINVFFLVYWLIKLKKYVWINVIVMILGVGHFSNHFQLFDSTTTSENRFSIMSFNVRLFNAYNWIEKESIDDDIVDFINSSNSSFVCLQEFYAPDSLPSINYLYSHIGLQSTRKKWRMATYSKYPIINKGTVSISGEIKNNVCIFSDIVLENDTFRVYNIHLASNWFQKEDYEFLERPTMEGAENIMERLKVSFSKRAKQVNAIKKHMNACRYPLIVCGDFNDTPNSYAYNILSDGLNDSFSVKGSGIGRTYNGKIPMLRIDYILFSPELEIANFETHKVKLSDHFPIESFFN